MKQLQIEESKAKCLYKTASNEFKQMLEDTFGKSFFTGNIIDKIKTYRDACDELGEQPINEIKLRNLGFTEDELNYRKLKTITKAFNEGWQADWKDNNQEKWFPSFSMSSCGFVFDDTNYRYSLANTGCAARLCFSSDELATYAGNQFTEIYKCFIL